MGRHIHLDALGGMAGDMFVAALLACWPEEAEALSGQLARAGFGDLVSLHPAAHDDGVLTGMRFSVSGNSEAAGGDAHRPYSRIRATIAESDLDETVKGHALGIFQCLARAEASVHGVAEEAVVFHEVGAWDSIADVISAAHLITVSGADSWSVSSLPAGGGRVTTAHGVLPVPVPAVTMLLDGYRFHDDGLEGERVTPTGAAILRHLGAVSEPAMGVRTLETSGIGFGTRQLPGLSNVLRAVVYAGEADESAWREQTVVALAFEVDDQGAEDLATGLDHIRRLEGVLDVVQYPVYGKKQRAATGVRVLVEESSREAAIAACFDETTTLGVRHERLPRAVLPRMDVAVEKDGRVFHAKVTQRPGGQVTIKVEEDDLAPLALNRDERLRLREEVESMALESLFGAGEEE